MAEPFGPEYWQTVGQGEPAKEETPPPNPEYLRACEVYGVEPRHSPPAHGEGPVPGPPGIRPNPRTNRRTTMATPEQLAQDSASLAFNDARLAHDNDRGPTDDARHQQLNDAYDDARANPALPWYLR